MTAFPYPPAPASAFRGFDAFAVPRVEASDLAPRAWEVVSLGLLLLIITISYWAQAYELIRFGAPTVLIVIMGVANYRMARSTAAALWTPLFGLRIAVLVFFGIGSVLPEIVGGDTVDFLVKLYPYSSDEAAKVNLIWIAGTTILLGSILASSYLMRIEPPRSTGSQSDAATLRFGLLFLAIGVAYFFFIEAPISLGVVNLTLPGSISLGAQAVAAVGNFLIALWSLRKGAVGLVIVGALMLLNILIGFVLLYKTYILSAVLLIGLAYLLVRFTVLRALLVAAALFGSLSFLQPAMEHARKSQQITYGDSLIGGTVGERIGYFTGYLRGERLPENSYERGATAVARLAYMPVAAFVVARQDAGMPSESLSNAFIALVPRAIWRDKPLISGEGEDLYTLMTGYEGTSFGATVPIDAYWNGGWLGLLVFLPFGAYLWWATVHSAAIVARRQWLMMPFVLLALKITLAVDNMIMSAVWGPAIMSIILYHLLLWARSLAQITGASTKASRM